MNKEFDINEVNEELDNTEETYSDDCSFQLFGLEGEYSDFIAEQYDSLEQESFRKK